MCYETDVSTWLRYVRERRCARGKEKCAEKCEKESLESVESVGTRVDREREPCRVWQKGNASVIERESANANDSYRGELEYYAHELIVFLYCYYLNCSFSRRASCSTRSLYFCYNKYVYPFDYQVHVCRLIIPNGHLGPVHRVGAGTRIR